MSRVSLGEWVLWRQACLRAPGFPAAKVLALAAPRAAAAADELAGASELADAARASALAALERSPRSKAVNRARRELARGGVPVLGEPLPELAELAHAEQQRERAAQHAERVLAEEDTRVAGLLQAAAREPRVREALLWQNRSAVHASITSFLRRPSEACDSKTREYKRLLASALQRYFVKNETIGFFGPVGWATLGESAAPIVLRPGPALIGARRVYFEHWCIEALAHRLARDPELELQLRPRRMPSIWLEGDVLHHPNGQRIELPLPFSQLLHAIDGERSASELAAGDDDLVEMLGELRRRKLCNWSLEIPTGTFHPERHLREQLDACAGPARQRALDALGEIEERRVEVASAAGDPDRLDRALGELESTFERLTGESATRKGGEIYAGRTLVFEDCRRDVELELGRDFVARLAEPLSLVLDSARWYTHEVAVRYRPAFRQVFEQLGGRSVDYVQFLTRLVDLFPGAEHGHGIGHDVAGELQARWADILDVDWDARRVERRARDLRGPVDAAFAAPGPGWPSARQHSPDVMIAAESADAIRRGDYCIVLGELHVGVNTVTMPCLLKEHPQPERLVELREADLPEPTAAPVWTHNRADFYSLSRHDFDIEAGPTRSARARERVLAAGALVVDDVAGALVARTRDGTHSFPILAVVQQHLVAESYARFRLVGRRPHVPRITIDHVVVQREAWHVAADALAFASEPTELGRFVAARRFAERHGMPRMVFAKSAREAKPLFVDFESPLLVDVLARQIRRAPHITFSEMLPALGDCWLVDGQGDRYTSELRLVATDPRGAVT